MPNSAAQIDLTEIEAAIEAIRIEFIKKLYGYADTLRNVVEDATSRKLLDERINEAIFVAHRIAGVAATFGYPKLGRIARVAESSMSASRASGEYRRDTDDNIQVLRVLQSEIASVCTDHEENLVERG